MSFPSNDLGGAQLESLILGRCYFREMAARTKELEV